MFDNKVKNLLPIVCQKYKTLFSPSPKNLDPKTTSANPSLPFFLMIVLADTAQPFNLDKIYRVRLKAD